MCVCAYKECVAQTRLLTSGRASERETDGGKERFIFHTVRGKDGKHNFFGQELSADKKAICIPQSFGGFGLFAGCIFVNTGPSELLNLSVHKCRTRRERERNAADELLYVLRGEAAYIWGF